MCSDVQPGTADVKTETVSRGFDNHCVTKVSSHNKMGGIDFSLYVQMPRERFIQKLSDQTNRSGEIFQALESHEERVCPGGPLPIPGILLSAWGISPAWISGIQHLIRRASEREGVLYLLALEGSVYTPQERLEQKATGSRAGL